MLPNKPRGVPRVNDRRVLNGIFWSCDPAHRGAIYRKRSGPLRLVHIAVQLLDTLSHLLPRTMLLGRRCLWGNHYGSFAADLSPNLSLADRRHLIYLKRVKANGTPLKH